MLNRCLSMSALPANNIVCGIIYSMNSGLWEICGKYCERNPAYI